MNTGTNIAVCFANDVNVHGLHTEQEDFLSGGKLDPREHGIHSVDFPFNAPLGRSYIHGHHAQNLAI